MNFNGLKKLAKYRGYSKKDVSLQSEDHTEMVYTSENNESILCILCEEDININYVGKLNEKIKNYDRVIIVKNGKITPTAKTALQEISKLKEVEIFDYIEIEYCPIEHYLSPYYEVLSEQDIKILLDQYVSLQSQLPRMLFSDPVRRYFGWKKGTVVREIHEDFIYYRIVV